MASSVGWGPRTSKNRITCISFLEKHGYGGLGPHLRLRIQPAARHSEQEWPAGSSGSGGGDDGSGYEEHSEGVVAITKGMLPLPHEDNPLLVYVSNQFHHLQRLLGTVCTY